MTRWFATIKPARRSAGRVVPPIRILGNHVGIPQQLAVILELARAGLHRGERLPVGALGEDFDVGA